VRPFLAHRTPSVGIDGGDGGKEGEGLCVPLQALRQLAHEDKGADLECTAQGDPHAGLQGAEDVDHFDAGRNQTVRRGPAWCELVERTMECREVKRLIEASVGECRDCAADGDRGVRRGA
jgi:hypothetical protein